VVSVLGDRIKELRKEEGLTQKDFALQFRLSKSHMSKIESSLSKPSALVISAICSFCNVNEKWLLTGEGEKYTSIDTVNVPRAASPEKATACYAYKYYRIACMLEKTCNLDQVWNGCELQSQGELLLNFIVSKILLLQQGKISAGELYSEMLDGFGDEFIEYHSKYDKMTIQERKKEQTRYSK